MIKKKMILTILAVLILFSSFPISTYAAESISKPYTGETRAYIYEWRYKMVGNSIYRRLFNTTTNQWVGDWKLVA